MTQFPSFSFAILAMLTRVDSNGLTSYVLHLTVFGVRIGGRAFHKPAFAVFFGPSLDITRIVALSPIVLSQTVVG